jgi:ABC-2 type transport system ATP-binding protein
MTTAIEVRGLTKQYAGATVVREVSFLVEHGEIFGIIGPNGAGKSTTVECIEGLRKPDAGHISVLGLNPGRDRAELRERVGVQLQDAELPARLRVGEALRLYSSFYAAPADWRTLMETLGLTGKQKTQFGKLSGGQRQRLSIALALVGRPEVVVLDELTTGLDPQARRDTWALIEGVRDRGTTIVLVTHFMEEAERLCDRIAVFDSGRIVALDTPAALVAGADADVGQRIRFRPDRPLDEAELLALPEVRGVQRRDDQVTVTGTGALLDAVTTLLARRGIVARQLRVDQASPEDAFIALTGRRHDEKTTHTQEKSDVR